MAELRFVIRGKRKLRQRDLQSPSLMVAVKKGITGYKFYLVYVQDMQSISYVK